MFLEKLFESPDNVELNVFIATWQRMVHHVQESEHFTGVAAAMLVNHL